MADYSTLTDHEINAMLAEKMGFKKDGTLFAVSGFPVYSKDGKDGWKQLLTHWAPCTSRDDLAVVVENMDDEQCAAVSDMLWVCSKCQRPKYDMLRFVLTCPPRIIAEACLEVLNG